MPDRPPISPSVAPLTRTRAWVNAVLWVLIAYVLVTAAVFLARAAFRIRGPLEDTLFYLLGAATLVALPAMFASRLLSRRLRTGHWMLISPQILDRLARVRTRPRGWRQASPWTWARFAFAWAGFVAFDRASAAWKRVLGWMLLATYALLVAMFTWFSLLCIAAGVSSVASGGNLLLLLGAGLLVWPGMTVQTLVRRVRTGSLRISDAEISRLRADREAWRKRESERPLHTKIAAAIFLLTVYSLWWVRVTVHHAQHPHDSRLTPVLWTPFVLYSIWAQFAGKPVAGS